MPGADERHRALVPGKVEQVHWGEHLVSGAAASMVSKLVLQPFDTAKTVLQASKEVRGNYTSLAECMVGIVKSKGLAGLYAGFLASIAVSAPSSAVFIVGYEFAKNALEKTTASHPLAGLLQPCAPILAASFGNIFSSVVRVPPEVVKQRVQAGMHSNIAEATRMIWIQSGVRGFYQGYSSMVLRDIPYAALQFMTFEALKKSKAAWLKKRQEGRTSKTSGGHDDVAMNLCIGAVAGAVACILTTPLDVVKTRVMTERNLSGLVNGGMRSTMKKIWVEEGLHGFGRGMAPRVLYKVPASAIFLMCYEVAKQIFRARHRRSQLAAPAKSRGLHKVGKQGEAPVSRRDLQLYAKPLG